MSLLRFLLMSLILLSTTLWAGVGKVALLKGEATLERGVQKLALQNGTSLEEKDTIKTSKDAQVQLMFEDKTVITLGSESEFKIEEYLNDTANPKAKFKFNQGAFKTITGQIGKTAPENFKLETKTATIGIRGTIVAGNVPPPPLPNMPLLPEGIFCLGGTITVAPIAMPNIVVVVPTGSFTQILTPSTPPSPPVIFTPADLQQLNQNLGGTPPPPSSGNTPPPSNNTPPPSNNTPPTGNSEGQNNNPPPPAASPTPQTFTPTAATGALRTNSQTLVQDIVIQNVAQELNVSFDTIKDQIQNQVCPSGTAGAFPNCVAMTCPENTTGIYPNCVALTCPTGTTGTYPNCVALTCPSGTTGTYPNCVALTCPTGTTGTYPNCVALTCPSGYVGNYPNCNLPQGGGNGGTTTPTVVSNLQGFATSSLIYYDSDQESDIHVIEPYNPLYSASLSDSTFTQGTLTLYNWDNESEVNTTLTSQNAFVSNASSSEYVYWGKWTSVELDNNRTSIATNKNFWAAGKDADAGASHISNLINTNSNAGTTTSYSYSGKVLGTMLDSDGIHHAIDPVSDSTNKLLLTFLFGSYSGLDTSKSFMQFTPSGSSLWNFAFDNGYANSDGTFDGYFSNYDGRLHGLFYGNQAQAVGGTFSAKDTNNNNLAYGAFAGNKTTPLFSIKGFATYIFNLWSNIEIGSSYLDIITYDDETVVGSLVLGNTPFLFSDGNLTYYNDQNFTITNFGGHDGTSLETIAPISEYVTWGKWTSVELDGNATSYATTENFWIAGKDADLATIYISNAISSQVSASYSYSGKVLGSVMDSNGMHLSDILPSDSTNKVLLTFNFGNNNSSLDTSKSYIRFTTGGSLWNMYFSEGGIIADPNFHGDFGGDFGGSYTGFIYGQFYGNQAQAVGGTFEVSNSDYVNLAYGAFVANKTTPLFSIKGLMTAKYSVYEVGNVEYKTETFDLTTSSNNEPLGKVTLFNTTELLLPYNATLTTNTDHNQFALTSSTTETINTITSLNTETNDYVSWGYWEAKEKYFNLQGTLLSGETNYWVAGKDAAAAAAHVQSLVDLNTTTSYTYNGKVLGKVIEGANTNEIDTANSAVVLNFDFGGGQNSLKNTSSINFNATGATVSSWNLTPATASVSNGTFSTTLSGTNTTGNMNGQFFGTQAQAVGGTLKAISGSSTALGVFKAVRP